jgi:hypothetical protein
MKTKVCLYFYTLIVELLKEENWNMHLRNQELQTQVNAAAADASKLASENTRLIAQTTSLTTAIETLKVKNAELSSTVAESKSKHEAEMSALRRSQAGLQRDRSDLQRHVDELKQELSKRPEAFLDNLDEQMEGNDSDEGEESVTPITQSPARSPQLSPIKNTPSRNAPLELETTKSSLHHAHRMVTNLRNNLHREKTEKLELKRLLATAQDEVEQLRNKASGSKRAGKKPQLRRPIPDLLGNRKTRQEISLQDDPQFLGVEWNDEEGSTSAAYVTANDDESDGAFMTATEHEMDETDTDAYRTGVESPSDMDEAGELTETESGGGSARRMPSMGYIREISPAIAFTSDEDDSPVQPLRHRRSAMRSDNGRRVASNTYDPPPLPLFQELLEGGSSVVNSPISALDSPASLGTARAISPFFQREEVETTDIACQCDPIPDPEPIVIQATPVTVYKERERPPYSDTPVQSDPVPDPEPIIIQAPPVIIYKERERPACTDVALQSDPIPDPEPVIIESPPVIIYKESERPACSEQATQSDPIPDPEPIVIQSPPVTIFKEREQPPCSDVEIQSDPIPPPEPVIIRPDPIIIPGEPVIIEKLVERERPASNDAEAQCDPIPPPEPIIIRPNPIMIPAEPIIVTKYLEREKPASTEAAIQSDPIPPPEPIIIRPDPIMIPAEPLIVTKYIERPRPASVSMAVQSEPLPPPEPLIVYRDPEKPDSNHMAVQSDPIPDPQPVFVPSEPIFVYREREIPPMTEMGVQSDEVGPTIVYLEREPRMSNEVGIQSDIFVPSVRESGVQSEASTIPDKENMDREIQTLLSIPLMETFQFEGQSSPTVTTRPKTPMSLSFSRPVTANSRAAESTSAMTPRTIKTPNSEMDWDNTPKSPLKEITNSRVQPGSPSRTPSMRYDSPSALSFSSRHGSTRRYGTILEHPTLQPSPRSTITRSRMGHPASPSRRHVSPTHSRMNMSVMSRSTTAMSRRTSLSSFESEVEDRFGLNREGTDIPEGQYATSTSPQIIQAITQTMIGDTLYKYTRSQMSRTKISDKRHRRFFWIHPYTKTLYWSNDNPAASVESKSNTRSGK